MLTAKGVIRLCKSPCRVLSKNKIVVSLNVLVPPHMGFHHQLGHQPFNVIVNFDSEQWDTHGKLWENIVKAVVLGLYLKQAAVV